MQWPVILLCCLPSPAIPGCGAYRASQHSDEGCRPARLAYGVQVDNGQILGFSADLSEVWVHEWI